MKKIFSILLALALVLSFSVVATPVSAQVPYAELVANITDPGNNDEIMGGVKFAVSANVTNNGTWKAKDVMATIGITGNATLQAGQVATKTVTKPGEDPGVLGVNWSAEVSWNLVCTGAGVVSINVTPSGKDDGTLNDIGLGRLHSDTVNINQKKVLQVAIFAPDGTAFNVTDEFHVTANVENISSLNATDVELTISIDRYAVLKAGQYVTRAVPGTLHSGETSTNYTWTLNCTGDGFSRITVSPSGKVDGAAIPPDALTPATVTVEQGVFDQEPIDLVEGWNLISLPLIPLDSDIDVVLAGILDNVISVWYYDVAAAIPGWRNFAPPASPDLHSMEDGKAYWIKMEAAQTLNLAGTENPVPPALPRHYDVVAGWNMVGVKATNNVTALDYLDGTDYVRIYGFEDGAWFTIPGTSYNTTMMVPGLGYWVAFTADGTIYP